MQIYISKDNRQWGPYEAKQVSFLLGKGSFTLQDWAWVEGGTEWIPVSQVLEGRPPAADRLPTLPANGLCLIRVKYPESGINSGPGKFGLTDETN